MKKLAIWMGNCLSIAGRATMISSSLTSTFIYHMSMYLLPKTTSDKLDKQRRTFLWQGGRRKGQKKKYHLIKWEIICKSKDKGGLGIKDIKKMNVSLLTKWWWKLETQSGLWQDIVNAKYMQGMTVSSVKHRLTDSPVWSDLMKVKHIYLRGRKIHVKNGKNTLFWLDSWIGDNLYVFNSQFYLIYAVRKTSL